MPLTAEQIEAMRAVPLSGMPNKLRIALALARVSQADVADALNYPKPTLSKIVTGRYGDISVENARKLADYFGCQIEDLFPSRQAVA